MPSRTYGRYIVASAGALACDGGLFLILLRAAMYPAGAAAVAYLAGVIVHWMLSTRFVFADGMAKRGLARTQQKGAFLATALLGLVITMTIVGVGARLGLDPRLGKLIAVAVSFQAIYLARRAMIFAA